MISKKEHVNKRKTVPKKNPVPENALQKQTIACQHCTLSPLTGGRGGAGRGCHLLDLSIDVVRHVQNHISVGGGLSKHHRRGRHGLAGVGDDGPFSDGHLCFEKGAGKGTHRSISLHVCTWNKMIGFKLINREQKNTDRFFNEQAFVPKQLVAQWACFGEAATNVCVAQFHGHRRHLQFLKINQIVRGGKR